MCLHDKHKYIFKSWEMSVVALGLELESLTMSNLEDLIESDQDMISIQNARSGNSLLICFLF